MNATLPVTALQRVAAARRERDQAQANLDTAHAALLARMLEARDAGAMTGAISAAAQLSKQRVRYHLGG